MTGSPASSEATVPRTPARAWAWPISLDGYDCGEQLSDSELEALERLGPNVRRLLPYLQHGYEQDVFYWRRIVRLLRPLDDARASLRLPDTKHRRASGDAIAAILRRCAATNTTY